MHGIELCSKPLPERLFLRKRGGAVPRRRVYSLRACAYPPLRGRSLRLQSHPRASGSAGGGVCEAVLHAAGYRAASRAKPAPLCGATILRTTRSDQEGSSALHRYDGVPNRLTCCARSVGRVAQARLRFGQRQGFHDSGAFLLHARIGRADGAPSCRICCGAVMSCRTTHGRDAYRIRFTSSLRVSRCGPS